MKPVWDAIGNAVLGVDDTLMNVWNEWIYPVLQTVIDFVREMWEEHLSGLFKKLLTF